MSRLLAVLLAAAAPAPALAQHTGHAPPPDPHAGHQAPQPQPPPDPHAGHQAPRPQPPTDPHAGHRTPQPQPPPDPHAGHQSPADQPDPHAGHAMDRPAPAEAPPVGPPPPVALTGPAHAADSVWDPDAMTGAREALRRSHGDLRVHRFGVDQLELVIRDGADGLAWEDAHFRYGGDIDRLWLKSEGEIAFGEGVERADVQALWSHAIDPWFDLQTGIRFDFGRGPERGYFVLGVQGLAPYWFELDAAAFLSTEGDVTARIEAEYDQRITERLILQPRVEAELSLQDVPELAVGSGLASAEAGLRLRYQIVPEFAPYVGIVYERAFGDTRRYLRAAGEAAGGWNLVLGARFWF